MIMNLLLENGAKPLEDIKKTNKLNLKKAASV